MLRQFSLQSYNRTADHFLRRRESGADIYDLDPPYQRGSVWSLTQRQNLIKSLVIGLPIGTIITNQRAYSPDNPELYGAVVDGKQRIETLRAFADDQFAVPSDWWLQEPYPDGRDRTALVRETCGWIDYDGQKVPGVRHSGLTQAGQRAFANFPIPTVEGRVQTIEQEAEIYLLVNFGGINQTDADRGRAAAVAGRPVDPAGGPDLVAAGIIPPPPVFDRDYHWSVMRALAGGFRNVWRGVEHEFDEDTALFLAGCALDALPEGATVVGPWGSGKHFEQRDCLTAADVARIIAGLPGDMPLSIARQEISEGVARLARMAREAEAR